MIPSTNFPTEISNKLRKMIPESSDKNLKDFCNKPIPEIAPYQILIKKYLVNLNNRGLLLYHQLGSGKTLTILNTAESMDRKVVIIIPAMLKYVFTQELYKHFPSKYKTIKDVQTKYSFVAYNSPSIMSQYDRLTAFEDNTSLDVLLDVKQNNIDLSKMIKNLKKNRFTGKFVVIDECHTFFQNVISANAKQATRLFEKMMEAKDVKFLFSSATPLFGNPYELAPLFNVLKGYLTEETIDKISDNAKKENIIDDNIKKEDTIDKSDDNIKKEDIIDILDTIKNDVSNKELISDKLKKVLGKKKRVIKIHGGEKKITYTTRYTLFPSDFENFKELFIEATMPKIKNKDIFQDRITGLVSHYPGLIDPKQYVIPKKLDMDIIKIPMGEIQFERYAVVRRTEIEDERKAKYSTKQFEKREYKKSGRKAKGTYKMKSRQICDFAFPEDIEKKVIKDKIDNPGLNIMDYNKRRLEILDKNMTLEDLKKNIDKYSTKMAAILDIINKSTGELVFCFSNFITFGLHIFSKLLISSSSVASTRWPMQWNMAATCCPACMRWWRSGTGSGGGRRPDPALPETRRGRRMGG